MTDVQEVDVAPVQEILSRYETPQQSDLIPILQETQEAYRYLPEAALQEISTVTKIPMGRIYGVVTFYAQFSLEPRARHTIRCCRGTACHVKGATSIIDAVQRELKITVGESTPDLIFYFETVACLGTCFLAPVMLIGNQYFGRLTPERAVRAVDAIRAQG